MCCSHGVVRYVIVGQSASQTLDSVVVNAWELTGQRIPSPLPSTHRAGRQPRNCFHIISRSPSSVFTCSSPVLAMALPGKQFTAPVLRPTGISAPPRLYIPARPVRRRHGAPPTRPFAPPAQSAKLGLVAAISETVRPFDSLSESPCGGPPEAVPCVPRKRPRPGQGSKGPLRGHVRCGRSWPTRRSRQLCRRTRFSFIIARPLPNSLPTYRRNLLGGRMTQSPGLNWGGPAASRVPARWSPPFTSLR